MPYQLPSGVNPRNRELRHQHELESRRIFKTFEAMLQTSFIRVLTSKRKICFRHENREWRLRPNRNERSTFCTLPTRYTLRSGLALGSVMGQAQFSDCERTRGALCCRVHDMADREGTTHRPNEALLLFRCSGKGLFCLSLSDERGIHRYGTTGRERKRACMVRSSVQRHTVSQSRVLIHSKTELPPGVN